MESRPNGSALAIGKGVTPLACDDIGPATTPRRFPSAPVAAGSLAVREATPALHRDGQGARITRRDDREYREYLREEQRSEAGCPGRRMQRGLPHGLLGRDRAFRIRIIWLTGLSH